MIPDDLRARLTDAGCPPLALTAPVRFAAQGAFDALLTETNAEAWSHRVDNEQPAPVKLSIWYRLPDGRTSILASDGQPTHAHAVTALWEKWKARKGYAAAQAEAEAAPPSGDAP